MQPTTPTSVVEDVTDPAPARRSAKAMFFAMFVIVVPVLALVAILGLIGDTRVHRIDVGLDNPLTAALGNARAAHDRGDTTLAVLEPTGLAEQWAPISAAYRDDTLRIGYVAPSGAGVQLVESARPPDALLDDELGQARELTGAQTIASLTWQVLRVHDGETALVLAESGRTMIVTGRAEVVELTELAASLPH